MFSTFNLCSNLLGWKDCVREVNHLSVLSHLETGHSITTVQCSTFKMCLTLSEIPGQDEIGRNVFFFEPLLVTSIDVPVLIRSVVSDGYFTFTGFKLNTEAEEQNIRLRFRIESQKRVQFHFDYFDKQSEAFR